MSQTTEKRSWFSRFGRWVAELVLVFVGVYAAFWLNNYQQHQQEAKRRDQILAALEQKVAEELESVRSQSAKQKQDATEFQRALDAGQMPPLRALAYAPDYSPTDVATLLQAGGVELLSAKTLIALRESESLLRGALSRILHYEKLSDELIAPNLAQDTSFFYDPTTKKLRKQFEFYLRANATVEAYFRDMDKTLQDLLDQIRAERQRS
jgi:hypothetical protein